ncbi:unnamed protein product, partial [Schistosoma haematobium]
NKYMHGLDINESYVYFEVLPSNFHCIARLGRNITRNSDGRPIAISESKRFLHTPETQ